MQAALARRRSPAHLLLFLAFLGGVYATAWTVLLLRPSLEPSGLVAAALTLDLTVFVPLLFHFLVVRRGRAPAWAVIPVFLGSLLVASRLLPSDQQGTLAVVGWLAIPAEMAVVAWIVLRARRGSGTREADPLERMRDAGLAVTGHERAAGVVATEMAVLWYGLAAWRSRPHVPAGAEAHPCHRRSGHAAILCALLLAFAAEALPVHLVLLQWTAVGAWLATAGSLYGALWLVADYRATVLRPVLTDLEGLTVRAGLRGTVRVPREAIATVERARPDLGKAAVNLTFAGHATRWIVLREPATVRGPYGILRRAAALGVVPDDEEVFDRSLAR